MARFAVLLVFTLCFAVSVYQADGLRCWHCSSRVEPWCNDSFNPPEQSRYTSNRECTPPLDPVNRFAGNINLRPVCKKLKHFTNGQLVIQRSCAFEDIGRPGEVCQRQSTSAFADIDFCETCQYDECNGASQYGAAAVLIAISAFICKFFSS